MAPQFLVQVFSLALFHCASKIWRIINDLYSGAVFIVNHMAVILTRWVNQNVPDDRYGQKAFHCAMRSRISRDES
eukprot:9178629-Prorocentrum_lima.AAC.1